MTYLIKFDENGKKDEAYPIDDTMTDEQKENLINQGFIETSEEDFILYCGWLDFENLKMIEYVRDPQTGRPVLVPPQEPIKEEQAQTLYYEYAAEIKKIENDMISAFLDNSFEYVALAAERDAKKAEYAAALAELDEDEEPEGTGGTEEVVNVENG